ncbi:hypothetical protein P3T22_001572 [Paraburkholderia sp. GAS348]
MGRDDLINLPARRKLRPLEAPAPIEALCPQPHVARKRGLQLPENLHSVLRTQRPPRHALFRRVEQACGITLAPGKADRTGAIEREPLPPPCFRGGLRIGHCDSAFHLLVPSRARRRRRRQPHALTPGDAAALPQESGQRFDFMSQFARRMRRATSEGADGSTGRFLRASQRFPAGTGRA